MSEAVPALRPLAELAAGIDAAALPEAASAGYRTALLDLTGAWLVGRSTPSAHVFRTVRGPGRGQGSGTGDLMLAAAEAAAAAHALELDDVHSDVTGWHPSVAAVPPLLAMGAVQPLHGADVLAGLVAGWEVGGRIGASITPAHRLRGFHATGTIGAIAATASVGRARGLDVAMMTSALGLSTSLASGTFGVLAGAPQAKHLHAAHGALAGILAVETALAGMPGPAGALDAPEGFLRAFSDGEHDHARLTRALGQPWEIDRLMIKVHACCAHAFGAIDAAHALLLKAPDVVAGDGPIDVHTYAAAAVLDDVHPTDEVGARFSVPFCVAQALHAYNPEGVLDLAAFEPDQLAREDLLRTAARVRVHRWDESDAAFPARRRTRIVAGEVSAEVDQPRGMPDNPVSVDVVRAKFTGLVAPLLGARRTEEIAALVDEVATTPDWVGELLRLAPDPA